MDWVLLAGRILFVAIFLPASLNHVRNRKMMAGYAASKGLPFAELAVPGTGLLLAFASVLVLLGAWVDLAGLLLAGFLLPTALMMHPFWKSQEQMERMMETIQFQKDISLAGAALALFYLFNQFGPAIGITVGDGRLFGAF
jgi:putative oxidoreductase